MHQIAERDAEVLSYLQGCGPIGEWVAPRNKTMAHDLNMSHTQLWGNFANLVKHGFIDRRGSHRYREYRVLVRLESRDVVQVHSRSRFPLVLA